MARWRRNKGEALEGGDTDGSTQEEEKMYWIYYFVFRTTPMGYGFCFSHKGASEGESREETSPVCLTGRPASPT